MEISIAQLATAIGADFAGDGSIMIKNAAEPAGAQADQIALAMSQSFADALGQGAARAAVLWEGADWQEIGLEAALFVRRPRYALSAVSDVFHNPQLIPIGVHPTAVVDPSAKLGKNVAIGPYAIISAGVKIGDNAQIFPHCMIYHNASIGTDALLHAGVKIGSAVDIGDRFIAQPGAIIGADGFSFVTPDPNAVDAFRAGEALEDLNDQAYVKIQSLGSVTLGNDVEMGANSTIDRGTISNTTVGSGTKIDNLVQIGHNVRIGDSCLLCGQAGVGGSSVIGDRVVLAGQVGVADHIRVGADAILTAQTGVNSHVAAGAIMMGTPAVKMDKSVEMYKATRRLPRLMNRFEDLQKLVAQLNSKDK